jgi:hypothetical protein
VSDEGRLVAGRYRVIRRIGTGAMGAVWQAQDEILHRTVAIKQLLLQPGLDENEAEDARQRTMREGRIAARLHHPNAITVFDVVTDDNGQPCLIMEYLESTSLAAVLQERRTLPPLEVARIGAQIAAALKEAHAVGIVHRDIKPGNILLANNGQVKITDFGISRATDDVTVTKTGMIAGTPAYLAPEVAIGGDPGPEADVFSLGSTLYAATEGQPPFGLSENTLGLLHAVAAGQINPPRQSGQLASVLAVLLHPDIRHRPTAEEAQELLDAVARGETPLGGPSDETVIAPGAGLGAAGLGAAALGAGVAGAALGATARHDDDVPEGHSGTLGDGGGTLYQGRDEDDAYDGGAGYPDEDYDSHDRTRALAAGGGTAYAAGAAYGDYDDGYRDGDPRDDYDEDGYDSPPPAEDDEKPHWKVPAAIGLVVVAGLAAMAVWLFGGSNPSGSEDPKTVPVDSATSTTTSSEPDPTTTTTTTAGNTEPEEPQQEQDPAPNRNRQTEDRVPPPQDDDNSGSDDDNNDSGSGDDTSGENSISPSPPEPEPTTTTTATTTTSSEVDEGANTSGTAS